MNNLLRSGIIYTAMGRMSTLLVSFAVNMTLSRILSPKEYGIVAVVQVFIVFFQLLVEAGMGPAIIQQKNMNTMDYAILFNYSIIFSIFLALVFGFFGYLMAYLYGNNEYISLCWLQAIAVFFNGVSIVPTAIMNKIKKFKLLNMWQVIASILSGVSGVILAVNNFGVYSLIVSSIVLSVINFLGVLLSSRIKISSQLNFAPLKKILEFSLHQFGFNFINYFSRNSDNILIGKFMGPTALGNYNKAYQLLMLPNSILLGIVNPVLQPILSEYQDDTIMIKVTYFKILKLMGLLGFPLSIFLSLFSKKIILLLFGNQWGAAVTPFSILALTVWIQMTLSTSGAIFQSRNKAKELMTTGAISACVLVTFIVIGVFSGSLVKMAIFLSIGFVLNFIISFQRLLNLALDDSIISVFKLLFKPFIVGVFVGVVLVITKYVFMFVNNTFLYLLIQGIVLCVFWIISILVFKETKILKMLLRK